MASVRSILKFDNILNVRDFGGLAIDGGGRVKEGKLLRGAQLSKMSKKDQAQLAKYNIDLVVDLRHAPERERQASNWESFKQPTTFVYDDAVSPHSDNKLAPHEIFIIRELSHPKEAHEYMMGSYTKRPHDPGFINVTRQSLQHMASEGSHTYVHCAAGKDRTGTFAAILLLALGVSLDDVTAEYMLTQKAVDISPILKMAATRMEKQYVRPFDPNALRPIFGVDPAFLDASLSAMGPIDNYLKTVIGISDDERDQLKNKYTVS
ncbi:MAG: tyrosine-protein phosphatase [Acidimicrobiales bacterium]|nr:tyrosine-protein phosphatase [Hyphomonadaceae bacterium]RZV44363.1 MAG: tyrosine-protein phosphatase [Acidimicrobiales bacterium]